MARFYGSFNDFKKYLGGYCKNKVNAIAKPYCKQHDGVCQYCGEKAELQAAHIKGKERLEIMKRILDEMYSVDKSIEYYVELDEFERLFVEAHMPIDKHIFFLCPRCHRHYHKDIMTTDEIIKKVNSLKQNNNTKKEPKIETVSVNTKSIIYTISDSNLSRYSNESVQDYIKRLLPALDAKGLITKDIVDAMQTVEYTAENFGIPNLPLLSNKTDVNGHNRYWTNYKFKGYYVCKEWWKSEFPNYEYKISRWLNNLLIN